MSVIELGMGRGIESVVFLTSRGDPILNETTTIRKKERTRLRKALFDELESRGYQPGTFKQLSKATGISKNTLVRVISGESEHYNQTHRKLANFLNKTDLELRVLFEVSDETESRFRSNNNDGDQHQTNSSTDADSRTSNRDNSAKKPETSNLASAYEWIRATSRMQRVIALLGPLIVIGFSWFLLRDPPECVIDLRTKLDDNVECPKNVRLKILGLDLNPWNGKLSALQVPEGWTVRAKYEKWEPPNYDYVNPKGNGFVLLKTGLNSLHDSTYHLYRDFELTDFVKITGAGDLNDRIQYLVISSFAAGELRLYAHKELDNPDQLSISVQ